MSEMKDIDALRAQLNAMQAQLERLVKDHPKDHP